MSNSKSKKSPINAKKSLVFGGIVFIWIIIVIFSLFFFKRNRDNIIDPPPYGLEYTVTHINLNGIFWKW